MPQRAYSQNGSIFAKPKVAQHWQNAKQILSKFDKIRRSGHSVRTGKDKKEMIKVFLLTLSLVAVGLLFLCVRILIGRCFINLHIDGNKALNRQGIRCVQSMDAAERRENPRRINEKSKQNIKTK